VSWPVPPLPFPDSGLRTLDAVARYDAVELFVQRARAVQPAFVLSSENAATVARVCARLDGIPLAIELAAGRSRVLAVQQLADRLGDCFRVLSKGSRLALPRHRTLQATINWSYQLLTDSEQVLFRQLSVFAGGFSLEAAEAVSGRAAWRGRAGSVVAAGGQVSGAVHSRR
jgi:predicted ATPase